ncbi:AMP-binding protein, partial [Lentzea sp. NPDC060358]|uniref:AMP-binding protein n=1 Tax=Lentzea sp. NPDC060358 TaxID=3347103 RepID=UPI0036581575
MSLERSHRSVPHSFRAVADHSAAKVAVRHGADSMTYEQLALSAGGVAAWLRSRGVGPGDVVATLLDR